MQAEGNVKESRVDHGRIVVKAAGDGLIVEILKIAAVEVQVTGAAKHLLVILFGDSRQFTPGGIAVLEGIHILRKLVFQAGLDINVAVFEQAAGKVGHEGINTRRLGVWGAKGAKGAKGARDVLIALPYARDQTEANLFQVVCVAGEVFR